MDANANASPSTGAQSPVPPGKPAEQPDYDAGLTRAMALVWEERGKYSVLSETFFALTRVWEQLCSERDRRRSQAH